MAIPSAREFRVPLKDVPIEQAYLEAPVIQVDGAMSVAALGGIVRFNLYQDRLTAGARPDTEAPVVRTICARLLMTPTFMRQIADWLTEHANALEQPPSAAQPSASPEE